MIRIHITDWVQETNTCYIKTINTSEKNQHPRQQPVVHTNANTTRWGQSRRRQSPCQAGRASARPEFFGIFNHEWVVTCNTLFDGVR